jgi:hypothetical protein
VLVLDGIATCVGITTLVYGVFRFLPKAAKTVLAFGLGVWLLLALFVILTVEGLYEAHGVAAAWVF